MKKLVELSDLEFVGGLRVPRFSNHEKAVRTLGFPWGGMTIRTREDGVIEAFVENGQQGRQVLQITRSGSLGTGTNPLAWPTMSQGYVWHFTELFPGATHTEACTPYGLCVDDENNRLWVSCKSNYNPSNTNMSYWVNSVDLETKLCSDARAQINDRMQRYGGGLTIIDQEWADENVQGRRLGLFAGGLAGGQGGSAGPTLAVMENIPLDNPTFTPLMCFVDTSQVGADNINGAPYPTKEKVERAFNDYDSSVNWAHDPEYPAPSGGPIEPVGYFATSSIRGDGAWIDHPQYKGALMLTRQPVGLISYPYQTECLSKYYANNLYVYDPDDFAKSARGEIARDSIRGELYRWADYGSKKRSVCYDKRAGYLWLYVTQYWQPAGTPEKYPILVAFKLKQLPEDEEMLQEQIDALSASFNNLLNSMNTIVASNSELDNRVQNLTVQVEDLGGQITVLNNRVTDLESQVVTVQSNLNNLVTVVDTVNVFKTAVSNLNTALGQ